ncbi:MAG TPA: phage holin family protein [Noviherbaspirillum sp.]|jgi:xanthine/uracil permease|uniref:phage holin family protein n=1 Tax=Noviherbaspirillum sp. TaxID=1926288 RepID=UPI002F92D0FC
MMIDKSDKSLGELFSDLTRDVVDLVRQEIELARVEMSGKVADAQKAVAAVAIGGAVLLAGALVLLLAVVKGVEMLLPPEVAPWLAPLIVGLVVVAIGFVMVKGGAQKLSADKLMPHRTMDSLKRDKMLAQEKMQ